MLDIYPFPAVFMESGFILDLLRGIDRDVWYHLALGIAARFWHEHTWVVYLALALATILAPHA